MLNGEKLLPESSMSWSRRAAVMVLLISVGGVLVGVRGPAGRTLAAAPTAKSETKDEAGEHGYFLRGRIAELQHNLQEIEDFRRKNPQRNSTETSKMYREMKRRLLEAERDLAEAESNSNAFWKDLDPAERRVRARQAFLRSESVEKLLQMGIALYNYYDKHKRFPPAVVMGPDGKTPHSWRVELLPYFEIVGEDLYKRYHLDEPWDSENNKKVLADGAELFSVPAEEPTGDCGYFVLIGSDSMFTPATVASRIRDDRDGSSKTIGVVEAKRSIPWTKPEDIELTEEGPFPKLGGFFEGGFNSLFMDGSVHFLPADIEEPVL